MVANMRAGTRPRRPASALHRATRAFIWLLSLIWLPCPSSLALNPTFEINQYAHTAWRIRDGFTTSPIRAMAQTPDGFLWLATASGLLRFDGIRTAIWQPPPGMSLPDTRIGALLVAHDGGLWIGTRGLASWSQGKLVTYPQFNGWWVNGLAEDRQGTIWVSADPGAGLALLCSLRSGKTECYGEDGRFGAWASSLLEDRHGNLWLAAASGLWRWSPDPARVYALPYPVTSSWHAITETSSGGILAITVGGAFEIVDGKIREYWIPPAALGLHPFTIFSDDDGAVWVGSSNRGLVHLHNGRMDFFGVSDGLSGDYVEALFEDHEANIWVRTDEGLDRFRALAAMTYSARQGLVGFPQSVLADRGGSVWYSTAAALYRFDRDRLTAYRAPGQPLFSAPSRNTAQTPPVDELPIVGFPDSPPGSLFQDHRGRLWLGAFGGLGYLENDRFVHIDGVPRGYVDAIAEDRDGNLWIAHRDAGLLELTSDRVVKQIPWTTKIPRTTTTHDSPVRMAIDSVNGRLWVAYFDGVFQLDDGQLRAFHGVGDPLGKEQVNELRVASDGTLWVATEAGLSEFRDGQVATLSTHSGLPCDDVDSSIEDEDSLWLYTSCGLVHIAAEDLRSWSAAAHRTKAAQVRMTTLDNSDGVRNFDNLSTYGPHIARTADGRLWLVARNSLTVADPPHAPFNKLPPPVHVEWVIGDHATYSASQPVHLPPLLHDLQIDYTALSLVAPERVQFRYKLEGRDPEWHDVGNRRTAFYTDLPSGPYRFRVIASNNSGVWNEQGDTLDFTIAPAFWQTIWFRTLCALAFLGFLWILYQLRLRQVTRQFELGLEARVAERTRIARELHDTLLQSFQGLLLRFQTAARMLPTRPAEAKQVLESTMDQAERALTDGRNAVQGLRPSTVESYDLADAIKRIGEELAPAHERFIPLTLRLEGTSRELQPIVRDEIYRIAGEALRNAYRHSGATRIEVELQYRERQFKLRVRDDGRGIDSKFLKDEGRGKHFGLRGMRERAAMIHGKLTLWTSPDSGTEVELTVPGSHAYPSSLQRRSWLERFSVVRREREQ
jgi:signal transduction histidine kinase/ligand-binding sensor domain-containing protein